MRHILITISLLVACFANGQDVDISLPGKQIVINGTVIDKDAATSIRKALGQETRQLLQPGDPTRLYIYDQLGINFVIDTVLGLITKMDLYCAVSNRFDSNPTSSFTGAVSVNGRSFKTSQDIKSIASATRLDFEQMDPLPWFTIDNEEFSFTITYGKDKSAVKMMHVIFVASKEVE